MTKLLKFLALGCAFSVTGSLSAQTVTVLESFEDNIDNVTNIGSRITEFEQSESNDFDQITDGSKALKIPFQNLQGYARDIRIVLDLEATAALEEVIETEEVGRYYFLYDITWDKKEAAVGWSNNPLELGGSLFGDQIEWGGGNAVITMAYEIAAGTPEGFALNYDAETGDGDQTYIQFLFNGNTGDPMDVYVDNIRLLDTKPEGGETVVTVLESFEDSLDTLTVDSDRAGEAEFNEDDFFVTDGAKSAKIPMDSTPGFTQDYTLSLDFEALDDVLALPQEERLRYTLAYDWVLEVLDETDMGWGFQLVPRPYSTDKQLTQAWGGNQTWRTYSINLGLVGWTDFAEPFSAIHNSGWVEGGNVNLYLDNLRLIDQGAEASAPDFFEISSVSLDAGNATLVWPSTMNAVYAVESSTDLQNWNELDDGVESAGDETSFTAEIGEAAVTYFRVRQ